jgi:pyrrolidone-carboxylate peptidase
VDYQATRVDFQRITGAYSPIAIISFGRGDGPWEIEYNAINSVEWTDDFVEPVQMSVLPQEQIVPVGYKRRSTLPVQEIANAVNEAHIGVHAWVDWEGNPGTFLCNYIAYLVSWYQDFNSDRSEKERCLAAGFIHVSADLPLNEAVKSTEITLETTSKHIEVKRAAMGSP